jgi:hypothetical protein
MKLKMEKEVESAKNGIEEEKVGRRGAACYVITLLRMKRARQKKDRQRARRQDCNQQRRHSSHGPKKKSQRMASEQLNSFISNLAGAERRNNAGENGDGLAGGA